MASKVEKFENAVYRTSGRAFKLLIDKARKMADTPADQRLFIEACIEQLKNDLRNT